MLKKAILLLLLFYQNNYAHLNKYISSTMQFLCFGHTLHEFTSDSVILGYAVEPPHRKVVIYCMHFRHTNSKSYQRRSGVTNALWLERRQWLIN